MMMLFKGPNGILVFICFYHWHKLISLYNHYKSIVKRNPAFTGFIRTQLIWVYTVFKKRYKHQGFKFFSWLVGQSDPWSKKWWVIFWNGGPKHIKLTTVDIWVVYFTYTLTQTLVCIYMYTCILTSDYTVKPVLSGHSNKKTNYRLMQVKSIAECSTGSILQSFRPSVSYHFLLGFLFCLFLSGCIRHVLLYWQPTCNFCFVEFIDLL